MSITSVVNDLVTSVSVINALKPLPPTISNYSVGGVDDTALDPAGGQTVQINGTGFLPGATITFDGSAVAVVTYVNPNQLTFTSPAKTAGTYTIYVVNSDGGTAIYIPGIIYSTLPTWTTAAGSLGSYYETTSISNTVVAAGDAPVTYSLFSGSLPTGSTLAANGVITGTAPVDSSSTTYSFTIQATDAQLQDSTRSFSLTINVDAVTWVSPANATTYTSAVNSAIANVALSATDAAGYNVSYSANALPTGLSLSGSNISGTPTVIADSSTLLTATAATTNRTATRTINWSITVANDAYFEYNTLLIPGASTTFVDDASTNNFAVTINGDTKPNSLNPYSPGYYSNYFAGGASDYVTASAGSSQLNLPGDFTVELWFYATESAKSLPQFAYSANGGFGCGINSYDPGTRRVDWRQVGTAPIYGATVVTSNAWHHVAYVKSGSTFKIFLDGILDYYNGSYTTTFTTTATYIGSANNGDANYSFTGYISNFRVVKGTAVYTTASTTIGATIFTPSTTPLTAIANTALLTCQSNRFIDNSTNALSLTVTGSVTVNSFQPFTPNSSYSTYGSGYFDGTGDYLNTPSSAALTASGNFTIEAWVYVTASSLSAGFVSTQGSSTSGMFIGTFQGTLQFRLGTDGAAFDIFDSVALTTNVWIHVAGVRSGNTLTLYKNGVSVGSIGSVNNTAVSTIAVVGRYYTNFNGFYANGYISDARLVVGTAVYTTAFTPPTAPLTAISGTSLLTLQNNQSVNNSVFLDNSSNNFLVTRAGNTTQGTFSPYGGNWSNYFASGAYIRTGSSSNLALGAGSWTCESWVFPTSFTTTAGPLWDFRNAGGYISTAPLISFNTSGTVQYQSTLTSSNAVSLNTWSHIAIVRNGTTVTIYINGVANGTVTDSTTMTNTYCCIGAVNDAPASYYLTSYVSNARLVVGTAVYTTAFTPPTTPLTAISGTKFLSCQSNRFIDNSTNAFALSTTGSPTVQRFSPFNPSSLTPTSYSGYFDGTGDYLTVPDNAVFDMGSSDFTIEGWVYVTATSGSLQTLVAKGTGANNQASYHIALNGSTWVYYLSGTGSTWSIASGVTIGTYTINTWQHIALVRSGSTFTPYLNGVAGTTTSSATALFDSNKVFSIGADDAASSLLTGYISNCRVVKGTAVYTSNFTPSTTPLSAIANTSLLTCQSTTFIDNSTNNFTITANGDSKPTQQNPFGFTSATTQGYTVSTIGGSGYFDGTGDYLELPASSATSMDLSTGAPNFTIECWFYATVLNSAQFLVQKDGVSGVTNTSYGLLIENSNTLRFYAGNGTSGSANLLVGPTVVLNTWYHVAGVRSGNTLYLFVNGSLYTSMAVSATMVNSSYPLLIGRNNSTAYYFTGYIADVRITRGTALYTSGFVPPTQPLTAVQNTLLLNNMTSAGIYDAAMMTNMETVADAKLSTAISKFGGTSMFFDGTGDYISLKNPGYNYTFYAGNWTIESWIYTTSSATAQTIFLQYGNTADVIKLYCNGTTGTVSYQLRGTNQSLISADSASSLLSLNTWTHIAMVRDTSTTIKIYVSGTLALTATIASTTTFTEGGSSLYAEAPVIGAKLNSTSDYFVGYMDDFRITKGYARYTANFTAPTSAFQLF